MKTRVLVQLGCVVGLLVATSASVAAQTTQTPKPVASTARPSRTDQEVRQTLVEYFKTVERHELKNFLAYFTAGEDLTIFEDKEMYDWKGFVAFVEGFFQEVAEITIDLEKCTVDPLSPSVAVATGILRVTGKTTSGEPVTIRNSYTFVMLKQGDRWRIKHAHECSLL
jgi:ketosteroid isomerase-like protein